MKRHLAMLAAVLVLGVAAIGSASAHTGFAISIGVPGVVVAAPPAAYYGPAYAYPYYYPGPVVYGYYGPYGHYRYWHR
jgi:hypothetical protein